MYTKMRCCSLLVRLVLTSVLLKLSQLHPGPQVKGANLGGLYVAAFLRISSTSSPASEESELELLLLSAPRFLFFFDFFGEVDCKVTKNK